MKTNLKHAKAFATVLLCSCLFFTGCEKQDFTEMTPVANSHLRMSNTGNGDQEAERNEKFSVISIEQQPARTTLPAYKVEVSNTGMVKFMGYSNTAFTGTKTFNISMEKVYQLNSLFTSGHFNRTPRLPYVPDVPLCVTTFQSEKNSLPVIRIDYVGQPSEVTAFRMEVIEVLKLEGLIRTVVEPTESYLK
jgi:hypothetical protein